MTSKWSKWGVLAASLSVALMLTSVLGRAAMTITTSEAVKVTYSLAPGATSPGITPSANTASILIAANLTSNNISTSTATLVHVPGVLLRWVGLESSPSGTVVHGSGTAPGTHIVYTDYNHTVDVEVLSADEIVVHNKSTTTQNGIVKLIW